MKKRFPLYGRLLVVALAATLVGCGGDKKDESAANPGTPGKPKTGAEVVANAPTYKIITNGISPFWDAMSKGLDAAKDELKVQGSWQGPQNAQHIEQIKLFKDAVASKVDGIAVSAIDADALAPTIDEATAAGIPVITFDSDSPKSKRLAYIGTNNIEAGKTLGAEVVKLFPNGGKLVAFVGNMSAQNARERYDGLKEALKGKNIEFLQEPFEDQKDKGRARKNVEDAITRYPGKVNGFVGLYSYNGPAIISAVESAGLLGKVKVICFDGEPDTLHGLEKGKVDVTVVQKPYEFGRLSIMLLNLIHKDKTYDAAIKELQPELDKGGMKVNGNIIDTGVEVLTTTNIAPFMQKLKEKGLEST